MCSAWASSSPRGGEERGRAVGPFLDVGAERGAAQHRAHLVGDRREPGREDLQLGRVHARTTTHAPVGPGSARQPVGDPHRAVGLARRPRARDRRARHRREVVDRERRGARHPRPQRDHLDRRRRAVEAVASRVLGGEVAHVADGELVALARVPAVEPTADVTAGQERRRARPPTRRAPRPVRRVRRASATMRTTSRCSGEHSRPTRGEHARPRRHEDRAHAQPFGDRARMERTRTAERDQREVTGVDALLDRHHPHRAFHRRVDHRDDAVGGDAGAGQRAARGVVVEAAEPGSSVPGGIRPSTRLASVTVARGAAAPVAGGPRVRARALRPHRRARRRRRSGRSIHRRRRWCGWRARGGAPGIPPPCGSPPVRERRPAPGTRRCWCRPCRTPPRRRTRTPAATAAAARTPAAGPESEQPGRMRGRVGQRHEPTRRRHHQHVARARFEPRWRYARTPGAARRRRPS